MSTIKADHSLWAELLFNYYIQRLMKKNFSGFYHLGDAPVIGEQESLIITPNHFSWWDGFFIYRFKKKFAENKALHLLMLESQLKRYWFFSKVGAYSIDPDNPKKIIGTVNYTSEILRDRRNLVVIYPQGEIEPQDAETLNLKRGIVKVIERTGKDVAVLPMAFKVIYGDEMNPAIVSACGRKLPAEEVAGSFDSYAAEMNRVSRELRGIRYDSLKNGIKY